MTSKGSRFVIRQLQGCFAIMGLPQEIKTDNGSGYTAQQTQDFLAHWGGKQSTGIPGNSTGQGTIERTHQVLKGLLDKQKLGEDGLSPQDRVLKAVYVMNPLWLVGTGSDPPALTHYSGLQQEEIMLVSLQRTLRDTSEMCSSLA